MKVFKVFISSAAIIVIIVAIAAAFLISNINGLVKEVIETIGSDTLKTTVHIDKVDIELKEGRGSIKGMSIANPQGFSANNIVRIGDTGLQIDIDSLVKPVKVIKEVYIEGIEFFVEQKNIKDTNIQALINNIESGGSSSPSTESSSNRETIRLMIERFRIGETNIQLQTEQFGNRSITMPGYSQNNIGSKSKGLSPDELGRVIVLSIMEKAKKQIAKEMELFAKEKAKAEIKKKLNKTLKDKIDTEKLKSLFK